MTTKIRLDPDTDTDTGTEPAQLDYGQVMAQAA